MANHSYVHTSDPIDPDEAERILRGLVLELLGDRLVVKRELEWESNFKKPQYSRMWSVTVPSTEIPENREALKVNKAPDDAYGFSVYLQLNHASWEFRHPPNMWESWAQDRVQHTIAKRMNGKIDDDGVGQVEVNPDRLKTSFKAFLLRNYTGVLNIDTQQFIDRLLATAPEGFRE